MKTSRYLWGVVVLWLVYVGLSVSAPATHAINQYRINLVQVHLLRVSILLPVLLIWLAAVFAVSRFRHYSQLVADSPEGLGFRKISNGVLMLFLVLVIPSFVSLISNFYPEAGNLEKWVSIVRQYLTIILYLMAFWYLYLGSKKLNKAFKIPYKAKLGYRRIATAFLGLLVIAYSWAIFHNQFRTVSTDPLIKPTYFLPDWLIISTIFIPQIVMWLWGAWIISNLHGFSKNVQGSVYRNTFAWLTWGVTATLVLLVALQFLAQASTLFGHSSLKVILIVIYILVLLIAIGYLFMARAARYLTSIEEA